MTDPGYEVRLLPDAPLSDDTEFVFINGRAFVNAAKHTEVVNRHIINFERVVEDRRVLREAVAAIADGHDRHNPGWWIKKAKAALAQTDGTRS